eukprot:403356751
MDRDFEVFHRDEINPIMILNHEDKNNYSTKQSNLVEQPQSATARRYKNSSDLKKVDVSKRRKTVIIASKRNPRNINSQGINDINKEQNFRRLSLMNTLPFQQQSQQQQLQQQSAFQSKRDKFQEKKSGSKIFIDPDQSDDILKIQGLLSLNNTSNKQVLVNEEIYSEDLLQILSDAQRGRENEAENNNQGDQEQQDSNQEPPLPRFMIRHNGKFRMRWDLLVILLTLYNCLAIPFNVAFSDRIEDTVLQQVADRVIDVIFVFDLLLNFRTTYVNTKTTLEIISGKQIVINYVFKGRFFIDVLSVIPFELLISEQQIEEAGGNKKQFKLFGLLKLIRLLRLGRIITYMKFKQGLKVGIRIVQVLFFFFIFVHWIGCIWYLIINIDQVWVPNIIAGEDPTIFYNYSTWYQYSIVYYYSILLLVGSDILPTNDIQYIFGSIIVVIGNILIAFLFGNMATLMASINKKDNHLQDQLDNVSSVMRSIKLPKPMQLDIMRYYQYINETPDIMQDLDKFFNMLSPALEHQIHLYINKKLIAQIDFFADFSEVEIFYICTNLKMLLYLPQDMVIRQSEEADNLYFINKGSAQVIMNKYDFLKQKQIRLEEMELELQKQNSKKKKGRWNQFKKGSKNSRDGVSNKSKTEDLSNIDQQSVSEPGSAMRNKKTSKRGSIISQNQMEISTPKESSFIYNKESSARDPSSRSDLKPQNTPKNMGRSQRLQTPSKQFRSSRQTTPKNVKKSLTTKIDKLYFQNDSQKDDQSEIAAQDKQQSQNKIIVDEFMEKQSINNNQDDLDQNEDKSGMDDDEDDTSNNNQNSNNLTSNQNLNSEQKTPQSKSGKSHFKLLANLGQKIKKKMKKKDLNSQTFVQTLVVRQLNIGDYFGEIGILTNLKRTASVKAVDYCTVSYLSRHALLSTQEQYPTVFKSFKSRISQYQDFDFTFRRKMIKNIPYFHSIEDYLADEIAYLLRPKRYEIGTNIIKRGDNVENIMLLKSGEIEVLVPNTINGLNTSTNDIGVSQTANDNDLIYLDSLNEGSCFCIYSPFSEEMHQLVNFRATTTCIVESINIKELKELEKNFIQISDIFRQLQIEIENNDKTDLDFFRYRPPRDKPMPENVKLMIRKKFRVSILSFIREYKAGRAKNLPALDALREFQEERRKKKMIHTQVQENRQPDKNIQNLTNVNQKHKIKDFKINYANNFQKRNSQIEVGRLSQNQLSNLTKNDKVNNERNNQTIVLKHSDTHNVFIENNIEDNQDDNSNTIKLQLNRQKHSLISTISNDLPTPLSALNTNKQDSINYSFSQYHGYKFQKLSQQINFQGAPDGLNNNHQDTDRNNDIKFSANFPFWDNLNQQQFLFNKKSVIYNMPEFIEEPVMIKKVPQTELFDKSMRNLSEKILRQSEIIYEIDLAMGRKFKTMTDKIDQLSSKVKQDNQQREEEIQKRMQRLNEYRDYMKKKHENEVKHGNNKHANEQYFADQSEVYTSPDKRKSKQSKRKSKKRRCNQGGDEKKINDDSQSKSRSKSKKKDKQNTDPQDINLKSPKKQAKQLSPHSLIDKSIKKHSSPQHKAQLKDYNQKDYEQNLPVYTGQNFNQISVKYQVNNIIKIKTMKNDDEIQLRNRSQSPDKNDFTEKSERKSPLNKGDEKINQMKENNIITFKKKNID